MRRVAVAVALFACAQTPSVAPPSGTYVSGTRLRAKIIDAGDGATLFESWHDAQLGFDCSFQELGDGSLHCVPPPADASVTYLDASCTQLAVASVAAPASPYVSIVGSQPEAPWCGAMPSPSAVVTVYELGGAQPSSPTFHVDAGSGSCVASQSSGGGFVVFAATEAAPATFVGAHVVVESRGALDSEILVADDGATELAGILDHATGAPCVMPDSLYSIGEGPPTLRCISPAVAWDGFYDDGSCSGPREAYIGAGCDAPAIAVSPLDASCGALPLFALGPVDPAVTPFYTGNAQCTAFTYTSLDFYPETGPADLSPYPALGESRLGAGRLLLPFLTAPGDSRALGVETLRTSIGQSALFDSARNAPCSVTTFSDGVIRCVTAGTAQLDGFSDAACTEPLAKTPLGCDAPTEAIDGPRAQVFAIGAPFTGTVYEMQSSCAPITPAGAYYTLGAPIDPSVFPALTERTE